MKITITKTTRFIGIALFSLLLTLGINACKKDDKPADEGDDKKIIKVEPDYILLEGKYCYMKNPKKGKITKDQSYLSFRWKGNVPGDSMLFIDFGTTKRESKQYKRFSEGSPDSGEIRVATRFGPFGSNPSVNITGGVFIMKRVNGFWVSTLKNGTGFWQNPNGPNESFSGIEFRITWPD